LLRAGAGHRDQGCKGQQQEGEQWRLAHVGRVVVCGGIAGNAGMRTAVDAADVMVVIADG
jgi:hypothetical protein